MGLRDRLVGRTSKRCNGLVRPGSGRDGLRVALDVLHAAEGFSAESLLLVEAVGAPAESVGSDGRTDDG